jgi:hypothetical protein
MELVLSDILSKEQIKSMDSTMLESIQHAVNTALSEKQLEIEKDNADKFDSLVENLTQKFDDQVNNVIIENVNGRLGDTINTKFYTIIKDMVNLLENSGIITTEKTKELNAKLTMADEKVESAIRERDLIKDQLDDATKNAYILTKLKGMKPEIVDAALEYFNKRDIREIDDDAIQAFLDGDLSNILTDVDDNEFQGDLDISDVEVALDDIKKRRSENTNPNFESLGKGLRPSKAVGGKGKSPDISAQALEESAARALTEGPVEDDTQDALSKIDEFMDLGYKFK